MKITKAKKERHEGLICVDIKIIKFIEKQLTNTLSDRYNEDLNSYGICNFMSWLHPYNKVLNCFALMIDGYIMYKFSMGYDGKKKVLLFKAEEKLSDLFNLNVKKGQSLTMIQLVDVISKGTKYDNRRHS